MDKSPIVTLNGLNTVYTDLLKRIEALGNIYHIKGSFNTLEDLINGVALLDDGVKEGDAYNVVNDRLDKDPTGRDVEENANYVCIKKYKGNVCTINNWTEYWFRINSAFEVANKDSLGLIKIFEDNNWDTSPTTTEHFVNRQLLLDNTDANKYKAYVSIPVASKDTYGVVDVNAQEFKGNKTFNSPATFQSGATITGKLSTSSVSDATNSLVIAPTDADTEVGDVYVGGTLTVANDAVFNNVEGTSHKLVLNGANDDKDYAGSPIKTDTSNIGNMNVGGTLTVSNSANVKTVEASNATFNITEQADIKKFKAIENLSGGVANLKVNNTATVGTVKAETATFNINDEATIANLSATNLKVNNKDVNFGNTDNWNKVDTLNVTSKGTSNPNPAELNVSTRADVSNVATTNLNAETINVNEFNGGTGASKGTLPLSYGTSASVKNIDSSGTLNCSNINVKEILSKDGSISFTNASTVNAISSTSEGKEVTVTPQNKYTIPARNTVINAGEINVGKVYSESSALTFTSDSTVSQILSKVANSELRTPARDTVINASTIDVATLTGKEGEIYKDLKFTNSAEVTTIANKSTEVNAAVIDVNKVYSSQGTLEFTSTTKNSIVSNIQETTNRQTTINASTIDVQALKGSTDNGTTINRDLTFTNSATVHDVKGNNKLTADTITVGALSGSGQTLTFTGAAEVSNIIGTTTLNATVIDVHTVSDTDGGTLNVGAGGVVSTPNVSIQGTDGIVTANKFSVTGAGTFEKKSDNVVNLTQALYIASSNAQGSVPSATSYALGVNGGIYAPRIKGEKVYGAVWNDLVDCIEVDDECELEYGRCYAYSNGKFTKTSKYAEKSYIGIHSDTSGFEMGDKGDVKQLKSSVAGYVLAYVDAEYPSGTPLTCSKNGVLTKAHFLTKILHPEMVIATYWKNEPKFVWGAEGNEIEVRGRHWVRIK